jgi:hypothetical protein
MSESEQFENPNVAKLKDKITSTSSPQEKIEQVAEKAAEKSSKVEQKYDKEHPLFSK